MKNHKKHAKNDTYCPFCDPARPKRDPWKESQCVLNKPLFMVIPPGGVHLSCPVHPEGHHVFGPQVTWMESPAPDPFSDPFNNLPDPLDKPWCEYDSTRKFIDFDSTRPYGTSTGFTGFDTFKFSM